MKPDPDLEAKTRELMRQYDAFIDAKIKRERSPALSSSARRLFRIWAWITGTLILLGAYVFTR